MKKKTPQNKDQDKIKKCVKSSEKCFILFTSVCILENQLKFYG